MSTLRQFIVRLLSLKHGLLGYAVPGLLAALFLGLDASAQTARDTLWQRSYGGTDDDRLWQIHSTSNGGFIIAGAAIAARRNDPFDSSERWNLHRYEWNRVL